jgi:para-aminobenzoate synthetase component 1
MTSSGVKNDLGYSPVFKEIPFERPDKVYARIRSGNSFLLESVKGPERIAGHSFIGIDPYVVFKVKNGLVEISVGGRRAVSYRKPLQRLRDLLSCYRQVSNDDLPPFQGGAAGMISYDFVRYLEKIPENAVDDLRIPDAHFFMIDRLIAFDHMKKKAWIIVCPGVRETALGYTVTERPGKEYIESAEEALREIHEEVCRNKEKEYTPKGKAVLISFDTDKEKYMAMVRRAKEYIAAGDIFQANLSLRVTSEIGDIDPWNMYRVLREINPAPFASFIDFGDYQIVSSSPERLVRVRGRMIDTRPIAGTRPRGNDLDEDDLMRAELLLNEKERAEHIMLIDLERNDLGRVSDYGSVTVDELMITEDYSHVIHIVSNVKGLLAEGKDCFGVINAAFPGGTITGVPKVRCMEIIDELEPTRRGPYTGSLGYIGFNGNMDLNIVIRSFLVKEGRAYIQAGAGIVADSDPEREYYECMKKAEALLKTLEHI